MLDARVLAVLASWLSTLTASRQLSKAEAESRGKEFEVVHQKDCKEVKQVIRDERMFVDVHARASRVRCWPLGRKWLQNATAK